MYIYIYIYIYLCIYKHIYIPTETVNGEHATTEKDTYRTKRCLYLYRVHPNLTSIYPRVRPI